MIKLSELKQRLEKCPEIEKEIELGATLRLCIEKVQKSRKELIVISNNIKNINKVYQDSSCTKEVSIYVKRCSEIARKMHDDIVKELTIINQGLDNPISNQITSLKDNVNLAKKTCNEFWEKEQKETIDKCEKVVDVVQRLESKLGTKGGKVLKSSLDKIKSSGIPQNDSEVEVIKSALKELKNGITSLGLEGPFGKFLEATIGVGASTKYILNDEVRQKLDEYNLWDSFKIKLLSI